MGYYHPYYTHLKTKKVRWPLVGTAIVSLFSFIAVPAMTEVSIIRAEKQLDEHLTSKNDFVEPASGPDHGGTGMYGSMICVSPLFATAAACVLFSGIIKKDPPEDKFRSVKIKRYTFKEFLNRYSLELFNEQKEDLSGALNKIKRDYNRYPKNVLEKDRSKFDKNFHLFDIDGIVTIRNE